MTQFTFVNLGTHTPPWKGFAGPHCAQTYTLPIKPILETSGGVFNRVYQAHPSAPGNYFSAGLHLDDQGFVLATGLSRAKGCFVPKGSAGNQASTFSIEFDWVYMKDPGKTVPNPGEGLIIIHDLFEGKGTWLDNLPPNLPIRLSMPLQIESFTRALQCIEGSGGVCSHLPQLQATDPVAKLPASADLFMPAVDPQLAPFLEGLRLMSDGSGLLNHEAVHLLTLSRSFAGGAQTQSFPIAAFGEGVPKDLQPRGDIGYLISGRPTHALDQAAYFVLEGRYPEAALQVRAHFDSLQPGACSFKDLKSVTETLSLIVRQSEAAGTPLQSPFIGQRAADIAVKFPIDPSHTFLKELNPPAGPIHFGEFFLHLAKRFGADCPEEPTAFDLALKAYEGAASLGHPYAATKAAEFLVQSGRLNEQLEWLGRLQSMAPDPLSPLYVLEKTPFLEGKDPMTDLVRLHQLFLKVDPHQTGDEELFLLSGLTLRTYTEVRRNPSYTEHVALKTEFQRGGDLLIDVDLGLAGWFDQMGDHFRQLQTQMMERQSWGDGRAQEYALLNYRAAATLGSQEAREKLYEYSLMTGYADLAVQANETSFYYNEFGPAVGLTIGLLLCLGHSAIRKRPLLIPFVMAACFLVGMGAQKAFNLYKARGYDADRLGLVSDHPALASDRTTVTHGRNFRDMFASLAASDDEGYQRASEWMISQMEEAFARDHYAPQSFLSRQDFYVNGGLRLAVDKLGRGAQAQRRTDRLLQSLGDRYRKKLNDYRETAMRRDEPTSLQKYQHLLGSLRIIALESPSAGVGGSGFNERNFVTALMQTAFEGSSNGVSLKGVESFFDAVREIRDFFSRQENRPKPGFETAEMVTTAETILLQETKKGHK